MYSLNLQSKEKFSDLRHVCYNHWHQHHFLRFLGPVSMLPASGLVHLSRSRHNEKSIELLLYLGPDKEFTSEDTPFLVENIIGKTTLQH